LPTPRKKRRALWWLFFPFAALIAVGGWLAYNGLNKKTAEAVAPEEKSLITDTLAHTPITDIVSGSGTEMPGDIESNTTNNNNTGGNTTATDKNERVSAGPGPLMAARYAEQKYTHSPGNSAVNMPSSEGTSEGKKSSTPDSKNQGSGEQPVDNPTKKDTGNGTNGDKDTPGNSKPGKNSQPPANPPAKDDSGTAPGKTPSAIPGSNPGKSVNPSKETQKEDVPPVTPPVIETPVKPVSGIEKPADPELEDADSAEKENTEAKKKKEPRDAKNTISPIIGLNYYRTLSSANSWFNTYPWVGMMYNRYIGLKWQLGIGLGYNRVQADSMSRTVEAEKYSFGVTYNRTIISTEALYYLDIPLLARYELMDRVSLMGGVNTSVLLNTRNRVQEWEYSSLTKGSSRVSDATSYRGGLTNWDIQLMLGAEYNIAKRWKLGLLYNTGLTDITVNNYYDYNGSTINRNARLQVFLRYDLFRF